LNILSELLRPDIAHNSIGRSCADQYPWVLDACSLLNESQKKVKGASTSCLSSLLRINLRLYPHTVAYTDFDTTIQRKAGCSLVLCCTEVLERLATIVTEGDGPAIYPLLCSALLKVAEICAFDQPVLRLTSSHLVPTLEKLSLSDNTMVMGADLWVG
jgi:hypothetical protein